VVSHNFNNQIQLIVSTKPVLPELGKNCSQAWLDSFW